MTTDAEVKPEAPVAPAKMVVPVAEPMICEMLPKPLIALLSVIEPALLIVKPAG